MNAQSSLRADSLGYLIKMEVSVVSIGLTEPSGEICAIADRMTETIAEWYEERRNSKGRINANVMCAGLYMTEFLAAFFPLTASVYDAGSQVKGASGDKAKAILAEHGEYRKFLAEGGRTSRATLAIAKDLASILNETGQGLGVGEMSLAERAALAALLQGWFVTRIRDDYFGRKKISPEIDSNWSVRATVASILEAGRQRGGTVAGAVAQHLVGAKLKVRFPGEEINVESYTTADLQTGRAGDYQIGDTAIHVTMSSTVKLFSERCKHNVQQNFRPRVLVPEDQVARAYVHADDAGLKNRVAVQSIEDFVGTNIEEVSKFSHVEIRTNLRNLLEIYNARVEQAEVDLSLKIEIPENL